MKLHKILPEQMKRKNLLLILFWLLFLVITISKSYSQVPNSPGYVILNNHDTIYARIENSHLGSLSKCVIIKNGTSTIQIIKPKQVNGFFISPDSYFQTKQIGGKNTFVQVISKGKIDLYEANMNLYISRNSDNLVLLDGEKKYFKVDSKTYSTENNSYKTWMKNCIEDTSYYRKIDKLFFDKTVIKKLIYEINGQNFTSLKDRDIKIFHQNQFSFDFGYSAYTFQMLNLSYKNDSLFVSYGNNGVLGDRDNVKHKLNAWQMGFSYKRNIKSTNLYLYSGLKYSKLQKISVDRFVFLHSSITPESYGSSYYSNTIGSVKDQFHYDLTQVSMPVGFYHEISHNLLRPFYSIGISGNYFLKKTILVNRTVYLNNVNVEEDEFELDIPSFSLGTALEIGCRYLINANYSISAGINWNTLMKNQSISPGYNKVTNRRFYFSFNF
ncbi:MAG: hypothetical protein WC384_15735 [Prolixibacteraceae bacterium]|jgi:hypothetical protein